MKLLFKVLVITLLATSPLFAQQTETEAGIELYSSHNYATAIERLKKVTKKDPTDSRAWLYLGMAYLQTKKEKEAQKAIEKAVELKGDSDLYHARLAYVYLRRGNEKGRIEAQKAVEINPKNSEAIYVLGVYYIRSELYNSAYDKAKAAIVINPNFAAPYLLKSQALVSSFMLQSSTVVKPPDARYELLKEASDDLNKYLELAPDGPEKQEQKDYLDSLYFFTNYYKVPENLRTTNGDVKDQPLPNSTPLKILSKPRPSYTDRARSANVQGTIRILAAFNADGKIGHILVTKRLGFGLDEQVLRAARGIKFMPASQDGKPVSVVKTIEYGFSIY